MFSRILVAYDGSPASLAARSFGSVAAAGFGCPIKLIHIAESPGARSDLAGVDVRVAHDPAAALSDAVHETQPPGLLCMTTRRGGSPGELLLGSTAAAVVRTLGDPLLAAGPALEERTSAWKRIVVCLDGSAMAASILPTIGDWARALHLDVHLVHVSYPLGDPRQGELSLPRETVEVTEQIRDAAERLQEAGVDATYRVLEDTEVAGGINRYTQDVGADLIAMSTHGRTALARVVTGSVAAQVLRRSSVPILLRRPQGLR